MRWDGKVILLLRRHDRSLVAHASVRCTRLLGEQRSSGAAEQRSSGAAEQRAWTPLSIAGQGPPILCLPCGASGA